MTEGLTDEELAFLHGMFDLAREGDVELLTAHVDAGLPVDLTNGSGDTLLLLAAYHRHADLVRVLLDRGADHARVNDRGQTALAAAVFRQDVDAVEALLEAGADPALGRQSALATASVFELPAMLALLSTPRVGVRRAVPDDLPAVERVVHDAFVGYVERVGRRPVPMDSDYPALVRAGKVWVAELAGDVIGVVVLEEATDRVLVDDLAGLTEVRLHTHELMAENLASYPRRGFRATHRETQDGRTRVFFTKVVPPARPGQRGDPGTVGGGP